MITLTFTAGGWTTSYAPPPPPPTYYLVDVLIDGARRPVPLLLEEIEVLRSRAAQYAEQLRQERDAAVRAHPLTVDEALAELEAIADLEGTGLKPSALVRRAKRYAHPDTGGSKELFQRVTELEEILRAAGVVK